MKTEYDDLSPADEMERLVLTFNTQAQRLKQVKEEFARTGPTERLVKQLIRINFDFALKYHSVLERMGGQSK